jgi:DnaJ-class molecular chaperone
MNDLQKAMMEATGQAWVVCPTCHGMGVTRATAPEIKVTGGKVVTEKQGSGCPKCLGLGRLEV